MPDPDTVFPRRRLTDARELRAMAHPLRVRLLEELFLHGPQTATDLAERVNESPSNCSWHLRQLAKFGYVEEDESASGRRRPWRPVLQSTSYEDTPGAAQALSEVYLARDLEAYEQHQRTRGDLPPQWRDAELTARAFFWFSPEELTELKDEIEAVITSRIGTQVERFHDHSKRPPDARPVRFLAWAHPTSTPPQP